MVSTRSGIDRIVPSLGGVVCARFTIMHGQGYVPEGWRVARGEEPGILEVLDVGRPGWRR